MAEQVGFEGVHETALWERSISLTEGSEPKQEVNRNPHDIKINFNYKKLDREAYYYKNEIDEDTRRELDVAILKSLKLINDIDLDTIYENFIEIIEDRLIKSGNVTKLDVVDI